MRQEEVGEEKAKDDKIWILKRAGKTLSKALSEGLK